MRAGHGVSGVLGGDEEEGGTVTPRFVNLVLEVLHDGGGTLMGPERPTMSHCEDCSVVRPGLQSALSIVAHRVSQPASSCHAVSHDDARQQPVADGDELWVGHGLREGLEARADARSLDTRMLRLEG